MPENRFQKHKKIIITVIAAAVCVALFTLGITLGKNWEEKKLTEGAPAEKATETPALETVTETPTPTPTLSPTPTPSPTPEPEKEDLKSYTMGHAAVSRGTHLAIFEEGELVLYENGQESSRTEGSLNPIMLMTDDALYYSKKGDTKEVCRMDFADQEERVLSSGEQNFEIKCMLGDRLYALGVKDENTEEKNLWGINIEDGSSQTYELTDLWGDVGMVEAGGYLYYTGGRTDVTATPLYRFLPEEGQEAEMLEEKTGSGLYAVGDTVYYTRVDSGDGSYIQGTMTVRKLDAAGGETEDVVSGDCGEIGYFLGAEARCLAFSGDAAGNPGIKFWNLQQKNWMEVPGLEKETTVYLNESKGTCYFTNYDFIQEGSKPYDVYSFDPGNGQIKLLLTITGYPVCVSGGYVVSVKSNEEWDKYVKEPLDENAAVSGTTAQTATPALTGTPQGNGSQTGESGDDFVLPDSDKRYYKKTDLEGLDDWEIRVARNELYARRGYIFSSTELKEYFEGKDWYHGTVSSAQTVDGRFNAIEKANLAMIQEYESNAGTN